MFVSIDLMYLLINGSKYFFSQLYHGNFNFLLFKQHYGDEHQQN